MTETMPPALLAAPKASRSKRLVFASTLLVGITLAFIYVHFAGGDETAPVQSSEARDVDRVTAKEGGRAPTASWLTALRGDLRKCEAESIFAQPFCREKAKFRHCKNRWGTAQECPQADMNEDRPV